MALYTRWFASGRQAGGSAKVCSFSRRVEGQEKGRAVGLDDAGVIGAAVEGNVVNDSPTVICGFWLVFLSVERSVLGT
jgi:hypothetical protein